jgi:flagellar basal body-associated protein FliL
MVVVVVVVVMVVVVVVVVMMMMMGKTTKIQTHRNENDRRTVVDWSWLLPAFK